MAASFAALGLALPPWRRAGAMASKWMPPRARDAAVGAADSLMMPGSIPLLIPAGAAAGLARVSRSSSGGGGSQAAAAAAAAAFADGNGGSGGGSLVFTRLCDGELRRAARQRRNSALSDGLSPPPPALAAAFEGACGASPHAGGGAGALLPRGLQGCSPPTPTAAVSKLPAAFSGEPPAWKVVRPPFFAPPPPPAAFDARAAARALPGAA